MHIDNIRPDRAGVHQVQPERPQDPAVAPVAGAQRVQRADRVEISEQARTLAYSAPAAAQSSLSAERIDEIRARVTRGDYDAPDVLRHVARQILADPEFRAGESDHR